LPDDMLVKVDRMTMAHSLEARVPFLDHRLIEYMVGVSKTVKMEGFERKSVLRNAIGSKLPPELLKAPKKGFAVPLRHWFANDALQKELNALQKNDIGMHPGVISELIEDNRNEKFDYGNFIWMLMVLNKSIESN
ncbi:MAG TPA: asparagine synthetase B, partial [Flavobacteriales bacterium]|nr:asparagine synthetase B [Flavobacteriales bacterium]